MSNAWLGHIAWAVAFVLVASMFFGSAERIVKLLLTPCS